MASGSVSAHSKLVRYGGSVAVVMIALLLVTITAEPASLSDRLADAKPGDEILLAPGDYGHVEVTDRHWDRPVRLVADRATLTLTLTRTRGLVIVGGTFGPATGKGPAGYAARVVQSSDVVFSNNSFVDSVRGLVIDRSHHISVDRALLTGMSVDGINIALSHHVTVADSSCQAFDTGKAHPDCIQLWSRPGSPPTSDVALLRNTSDGDMQGFTAFNTIRDGVSDGGFDRISVIGNRVRSSYPQGIALYDCRDCFAADNAVETIAGSRFRTSINFVRSTVRQARNSVGNHVPPR